MHMYWDCPEKKSANLKGDHIVEDQENIVEPKVKEETPNMGEALVLKRVLKKIDK
jgi:hypothetical protein